jgi:hypothetical protein
MVYLFLRGRAAEVRSAPSLISLTFLFPWTPEGGWGDVDRCDADVH